MGPRINHSENTDAGFTLIELMIVVTVLSILIVSVGLSMSSGRSDARARDDVQSFQTRFDQLQSSAIHTRRPHGMQVTPLGWQVVQFDPTTQTWDFSGTVFRWAGSAVFQPSRRLRATTSRQPDITFLPSGQSTAFEIRFATVQAAQTCRTDGWTGVTCDPS